MPPSEATSHVALAAPRCPGPAPSGWRRATPLQAGHPAHCGHESPVFLDRPRNPRADHTHVPSEWTVPGSSLQEVDGYVTGSPEWTPTAPRGQATSERAPPHQARPKAPVRSCLRGAITTPRWGPRGADRLENTASHTSPGWQRWGRARAAWPEPVALTHCPQQPAPVQPAAEDKVPALGAPCLFLHLRAGATWSPQPCPGGQGARSLPKPPLLGDQIRPFWGFCSPGPARRREACRSCLAAVLRG